MLKVRNKTVHLLSSLYFLTCIAGWLGCSSEFVKHKKDPHIETKTPESTQSSPPPDGGPLTAQTLNSFRPGVVWNDTDGKGINAHGGGFYYENGIYYWFGEHKGEDGVARVGIHVYSSKDLYNWKDEGIALEVDKTNPASEIAEGCVMERPKVIFNAKTKKYVMWFHLELKGQGYNAARAGVAVSDRVQGPYVFQESFRPNDSMSRDQTLFVDDDGTAYQFASSENNRTMHINQLTDDYLRPNGKFVRVFENRLMEAPAVFKYLGRYYFIASGCTWWDPNAARQAVADNIFGPWTELGNPATGLEAGLTFRSQSTYVLEVKSSPGRFIFIGDRWNSKNLGDSRYIWLPLTWKNGRFSMSWLNEWNLTALSSAE